MGNLYKELSAENIQKFTNSLQKLKEMGFIESIEGLENSDPHSPVGVKFTEKGIQYLKQLHEGAFEEKH